MTDHEKLCADILEWIHEVPIDQQEGRREQVRAAMEYSQSLQKRAEIRATRYAHVPTLCRLCNAPATRSYSIIQHGKDLVTALCERCFSKI